MLSVPGEASAERLQSSLSLLPTDASFYTDDSIDQLLAVSKLIGEQVFISCPASP